MPCLFSQAEELASTYFEVVDHAADFAKRKQRQPNLLGRSRLDRACRAEFEYCRSRLGLSVKDYYAEQHTKFTILKNYQSLLDQNTSNPNLNATILWFQTSLNTRVQKDEVLLRCLVTTKCDQSFKQLAICLRTFYRAIAFEHCRSIEFENYKERFGRQPPKDLHPDFAKPINQHLDKIEERWLAFYDLAYSDVSYEK